MTSWLRSKSITVRIALVAVILSVGVVGFAAVDVLHRYFIVQNMNHASEIVGVVPPVGGLIHELQKERGQSAGFISTRGNAFADTLPDVRVQTDASFEVATAAFATLPFDEYPTEVQTSIEDATKNLERLQEMRSSVDGLQLTTPKMAAFYTETINKLLHLVAELRKANHEDDVSRELMAHLSLLYGKENAGLERAMGAVGFGKGVFERPIYNNMIRFIEKQDAYFLNYKELSDKPHREFFEETLSGPFIERVERLREIAFQSPETGSTNNISGATWFEATTARINLMKKVEDYNVVLLEKMVQGKLSSAWNILLLEAIVTIVLLSVSIAAVFVVTRSIKNDIGGLSDVMDRLAGGDHSVDIAASDRKDEIGSITNAVLTFKNAAIEKAELERQAHNEERAKQAKQKELDAERRQASQNIERAVHNIGSALNSLADGRLSTSIDVQLSEEYEKLKLDFNSASARLKDTLTDVLQNADDIMCGTREIAQASDDMSRRTENQAETLEQTASALDQITKTVTASAESAAKAQSIVNVAAEGAQRGGEVVDKAVEAMSAIEASSKEVSDITGVIDEIAFQTNLLALNAGVEAARAGESGKGFAVVATEVRELAQRSAQAAKQIKNLITNSNTQIESGVQLVRESGSNLKSLVEEIQNLNVLVRDISEGASSQADGLAEINQSVGQLDQVTQQNAAMAEEATAATRTLATKSEHLAKLVSEFDLGANSSDDNSWGGNKTEAA